MNGPSARIGVIGGSGLYHMEGLEDVQEVEMATPFGKPSDAIAIGRLAGVPVAFLPRHGRGHRIMPTHIPVKANIYALKTARCRAGHLHQRRGEPPGGGTAPGFGDS